MKSLSQRATVALACICVFFAVVIGAVAAVGVVGVRSATHVGTSIDDDELLTATTTAQLANSVGVAYAAGDRALLSGDPLRRSRLASAVYTRLVPQVDSQLADLERLHADDPPAELQGIQLLGRQWTAMRNLLSPALAASGPDPVLAARLTDDDRPIVAHFAELLAKENHDADADDARQSFRSAMLAWLIVAAAAVGVLSAGMLAWVGRRRVIRAVEPERAQVEFADTLQIAGDESEAHHLLQRHLERSLADTTAVVLNRNNSADRLEAVTALTAGSPLAGTIRQAVPRSCLAVRSGRTHRQNGRRSGLLACPLCSACPGNSNCTPLTVGGEVIGAVLLNRAVAYNSTEEQRIRDSVGQAAPVLANLRNLAIAEVLAATDSLTGLPNKRAVTDTVNRMFAQAARDGSPLAMVLLDLDHFKDVNDRHGHPVGDQALANVGAALRSVLRAGDFAGRNGGEEFALLLPDTDAAAAVDVAERVRVRIADIALPNVNLTLTASLGVATYPEHARTPERLERLADTALYLAKRSGRNRTEIADTVTGAVTGIDGTTNGSHAEPAVAAQGGP